MKQKHLKGKEMKPLCLLWKAILKGYKSAVLEYSSFKLFFIYLFIYLFIFYHALCFLFSIRTYCVTELRSGIRGYEL